MISLKWARRMALTTFILGTILFALQLVFSTGIGIAGFGLMFIAFALLVNGIAFLIALIDLIKTDHLESFYAMCILLINLPVAAGYAYIILEHGI